MNEYYQLYLERLNYYKTNCPEMDDWDMKECAEQDMDYEKVRMNEI
jgi:hypothetical protein